MTPDISDADARLLASGDWAAAMTDPRSRRLEYHGLARPRVTVDAGFDGPVHWIATETGRRHALNALLPQERG